MQKKKAITKSKVGRKKTSISKEDDLSILDEQGNDIGLVDVKGGKCLVHFPTNYYSQGGFDGDLGFIAVLIMKGIDYEEVNYKDPYEVVYEFLKKDARKIGVIQSAYFNHALEVDAKEMSDLTISLVNYIVPTGARYNFSGKRNMKGPLDDNPTQI
jgi:hypothetical protein